MILLVVKIFLKVRFNLKKVLLNFMSLKVLKIQANDGLIISKIEKLIRKLKLNSELYY